MYSMMKIFVNDLSYGHLIIRKPTERLTIAKQRYRGAGMKKDKILNDLQRVKGLLRYKPVL